MKVPRVDAKWDNVFIICAILCAIPSLIGILVVGYVVLVIGQVLFWITMKYAKIVWSILVR